LVVLLFISGCSTLAVKRDESRATKIFNYPYDKVWAGLINVIFKEGDTIVKKNEEKRMILTGYDKITVAELKRISQMPPLFQSSGLAGAWLYARIKIDYFLYPVSETETQVKMIAYLQGYNASGARWINILTDGTKEKETFDALQLSLEKENN